MVHLIVSKTNSGSIHPFAKVMARLPWYFLLILLMGCSQFVFFPFDSSDPRSKPDNIASISQTIDGFTVTLSNFRIVNDYQKKYLLMDICINNPNHNNFSRFDFLGVLEFSGRSKYISTGLLSSKDPACDEWAFYFYSDDDLSMVKITIQSIVNVDDGHSLNQNNESWVFIIPQDDFFEQEKLSLIAPYSDQPTPSFNMNAGVLSWGGGENVNGQDGQAIYVNVCYQIPNRSSWMIWDAA
jgi:hypothetical protein